MPVDNDFESKDLTTLVKWYKNRIYLVEMRQKDNMTDYQIKTHGTPTVGDRLMDQAILNGPLSKYITIPDMMAYYRNGIRIIVAKESNCSEIYRLCKCILDHWAHTIRRGVNINSVPTEEMLQLDEFLKVMFPLAARTMKETNIDTLFNPFVTMRVEKKAEDKIIRRHDSIQEEMVDYLFGGVAPKKKTDDFLDF